MFTKSSIWLLGLLFGGMAAHAQNSQNSQNSYNSAANSTNSTNSVVVFITDSASGQGLDGAILKSKNSFLTIVTGKSGRAILPVSWAGNLVQISYLGYESKTILIGSDSTQIRLRQGVFEAEAVIVAATRLSSTNAFAHSNLNKEQIGKQNLGQDLPILLQTLPSVVSWSDAGAGVGYSGFRVRGSDPSRTNVTINGIPTNDSESQNVFWVNMPDLAASVDNIELQRGVGTSTHGAGAFGASLNIQTSGLESKPTAQTDHSFGSFDTRKHSVRAHTGLLKSGFAFDVRLSKVSSEGYIRPGFSDLNSFFSSAGWYGKKSMAKLLIFSGNERTYQAWNGVPESRFRNNLQGMNDYISRNGLSEPQATRLLNSGPNYNVFDYKNQTDNYSQTHYQLHYSNAPNPFTNLNLALHYTGGGGFYEEYKANQAFGSYNLDTFRIGNELIDKTDLIRRRHLKNHFYGITLSLNHTKQNWAYSFGAAANRYNGLHYGDIIWARFASGSELGHRFYEDKADKNDLSVFGKVSYTSGPSSAYLDLQGRSLFYRFMGVNRLARLENRSISWAFFNPKAGYTYNLGKGLLGYMSVAIAHREPNRDDLTDSPADQQPKPEQLTDYEAGLKYNTEKLACSLNGFYMDYHNQLVLTGRINDVGNYVRTNVARSYRAGAELEMAFLIHKKLKLAANISVSQNKILAFSQFSDSFDADFNSIGQQETKFENTTIALSPAVVGAGRLVYNPIKNMEISWIHKYVSRQYLDNSQDKTRSLDAFWVTDLHFYYPIKILANTQLGCSFQANNLLDIAYTPNGYTYDYLVDGQRVVENFVFPQAGRHYMMGVSLRF